MCVLLLIIRTLALHCVDLIGMHDMRCYCLIVFVSKIDHLNVCFAGAAPMMKKTMKMLKMQRYFSFKLTPHSCYCTFCVFPFLHSLFLFPFPSILSLSLLNTFQRSSVLEVVGSNPTGVREFFISIVALLLRRYYLGYLYSTSSYHN